MKAPRHLIKKYHCQEFAGQQVLMCVVSDMTNQELVKALNHFTEREDFEYCEQIIAEAESRGISLIIKNIK